GVPGGGVVAGRGAAGCRCGSRGARGTASCRTGDSSPHAGSAVDVVGLVRRADRGTHTGCNGGTGVFVRSVVGIGGVADCGTGSRSDGGTRLLMVPFVDAGGAADRGTGSWRDGRGRAADGGAAGDSGCLGAWARGPRGGVRVMDRGVRSLGRARACQPFFIAG